MSGSRVKGTAKSIVTKWHFGVLKGWCHFRTLVLLSAASKMLGTAVARIALVSKGPCCWVWESAPYLTPHDQFLKYIYCSSPGIDDTRSWLVPIRSIILLFACLLTLLWWWSLTSIKIIYRDLYTPYPFPHFYLHAFSLDNIVPDLPIIFLPGFCKAICH